MNPLKWNEPFGLTMAESLACGTPVIAFSAGSAPEVVQDGETGFLVGTATEMAERMKEAQSLSRQKCRARAEEFFTAEKMTAGYSAAYKKLL